MNENADCEFVKMNTQKFAKRLQQLRSGTKSSAMDMSLRLGKNETYINKIELGRALPSMTGFFYICDYLEITPQEFFEDDTSLPMLLLLHELNDHGKNLDEESLRNLIGVAKKMAGVE